MIASSTPARATLAYLSPDSDATAKRRAVLPDRHDEVKAARTASALPSIEKKRENTEEFFATDSPTKKPRAEHVNLKRPRNDSESDAGTVTKKPHSSIEDIFA